MGVKVNAVFEGGGVKGIGLVGGIKAAEEAGIAFDGLAGTSSGALVASLLAAGYTADEMKSILLNTSFTFFLKRSVFYQIPLLGPIIRLFVKKGLYSGEVLEAWVRQLLWKKGIRTFEDLGQRKLKIVASDISQGRLLVLPDDIQQYGIDPQRMEVARAVRMSASIPYFFDPVIIRKPPATKQPGELFNNPFIYIVDGGILSNFPLWIFDKEAMSHPSPKKNKPVPTIGFSLVGRHERTIRPIYGPFTMFQALFATMMEAHDERYIEKNNRFRTVKIPTLGVNTTQFDIPPEKSGELYASGLKAGREFFGTWSENEYHNQFSHLFHSSHLRVE